MEKNILRNSKGHFVKGHADIVPIESRIGRTWIARKHNGFSTKYESCLNCGSSKNKHRGKGICEDCHKKLHPIAIRKHLNYSDATRPKPKNCEICNREGTIVFDHCHKNNKFRGWICMSCNTSLGHVKDKIEILQQMITYLVKNS